MASALEAAERDSASVDASGGRFAGKMGTVHSVKAKRRSREQVSVGAKFERCVACGSSEHSGEMCRFKTYVCSRCKKTGHLRRVCPAGTRNTGGWKKLNSVEAKGSDIDSEQEELQEDVHQLTLNCYKPVDIG
ncbi:hypothetical protein ACJJTC_002403 [Scirpophaga incertulas]